MTGEEFYIDSDGIRLHAKLDRPRGSGKGPLCFLVHGFTGHMEEEHIIAARDALLECNIAVLRKQLTHTSGVIKHRQTHLYRFIIQNIS